MGIKWKDVKDILSLVGVLFLGLLLMALSAIPTVCMLKYLFGGK